MARRAVVDQRRDAALLSEYTKYVAAEVRVRLADAGIDLVPELSDQPAAAPRRPATAQAN
jgi:hypothetical protein